MSLSQHPRTKSPGTEVEESGARLRQAKTDLLASGPPCLICVLFPSEKDTALGRTRMGCSQPAPAFSLWQALLSPQGFRQAVRFLDCQRLQCELRRGRCRRAPGLEPSGAWGEGTPGLIAPHSCPHKKVRLQAPAPPLCSPSCGHLVLCLVLPRAHGVKTFWPFLF